MAMNREQKRLLQRQGAMDAEGQPTRTTRRPPAATARQRTGPVQFTREVRQELRKVAWPTRSEVVNYSIIVFFAVLFVTALVSLLDTGFSRAVFSIFDA